jgi:ribosomal protein S18 acetylase RimI-like enzyme
MPRIETAGLHDLPGAYRVCLLAGDAGRDASPLHRDPDLLGHVFVGPYITAGTGTQRVVVDDEGVAGYLLSTDDTLAFETWAETTWWPPLRERYPPRDDGSRDAELIAQIHAPERTPEALAKAYPAHLHIDLLERVRGLGVGRALIDGLLVELHGRGIRGVHLGVDEANANAIGFYEHLGFVEVGREPGTLLMGQPLGERDR